MKLPKFLIQFTGNFYLHKFPFFGTYKPSHHKVKGHEVRKVLDCIEPGDILLRRFDGYLNTIFTPGFWGHAGLYVGNNKITHAISKGVIEEDILDFCRTDSVCVLRLKNITKMSTNDYIKKAFKFIGISYDYGFSSENKKLYCTEYVDVVYDNIFKQDYKVVVGNNVLIPDGIFDSNKVEKILVIKH